MSESKEIENEDYGMDLNTDDGVRISLHGKYKGKDIDDYLEVVMWLNEEIDNENDAKEASDNAIWCFYNDPKWLINTFESRIDSQIMEESKWL